MKPSLSFCLAVLVLPALTARAQEASAPTDDQILSHCMAEFKNVNIPLNQYSFTERVTSEIHHSNGKGTHHEVREFEFVPRPDGRFDIRLLSVDDSPPSDKQLKEQEKQMNQEFSKSDKQVAEEKEKAQEEDVSFSQDFFEYFDFKYTGREEWHSRPAFVIEFTPKPETPQMKDKKRKILRNMNGHIWMSQAEYRLLGSEMHNVGSIKTLGGIGGIDHLDIKFEYFDDASGAYLPKVSITQYDVRAGFSNVGLFTRTEEYSKFRKVEIKPTPDKAPE